MNSTACSPLIRCLPGILVSVEKTPAYRRTLSFALAEVSQVAFLADLLQHLIRGGGG
jgi:hypothetical protein